MLFGLGVVFSRFMNQIFSDIIERSEVIFLGDLLIYSEDETLPDPYVQVLNRLRGNHLC